jgi:ornithine carbamoyltransferase
MASSAASIQSSAPRHGRRAAHVLSVADLLPEEIEGVVEHALELKQGPFLPAVRPPLAGRSVALLFEKPSLRTRVSFEVGLARLGTTPVVLGGAEVGLGSREATEDVARTLSRYVDAIVARVVDHTDLQRLAAVSSVPVINALSDREHPCQALADLVTLQEHLGGVRGRTLAFVGDGNNVANSLLLAGTSVGLHVRVASPSGHEPDRDVVADAETIAASTGGSVRVTNDPVAAVSSADAVYTDVWASMGQEGETRARQHAFAPYAVTTSLLRHAPDAIVLHCLPAHRGQEIEADVIDGPQSVVFDQAENRLYAQQALMLRLLIPGRSRDRGARRAGSAPSPVRRATPSRVRAGAAAAGHR